MLGQKVVAASGQLLSRGLVLANAISRAFVGSNQSVQPNPLRVVVDETIPKDTTCML
jgi:hypothetical protein